MRRSTAMRGGGDTLVDECYRWERRTRKLPLFAFFFLWRGTLFTFCLSLVETGANAWPFRPLTTTAFGDRRPTCPPAQDITNFVQQCLRDRDERVPPEDILQVSQRIKEKHCYVAQDIAAV